MSDQTGQHPRVYFDNGTWQVSTSLLSTPRRFYPIQNTTARIRRDPLWLALGLNGFAAGTSFIYGDLLYLHELCALWGVVLVSGLIGLGTAILHVDSVGHPHALLFSSARTIRKIYQAMRAARMDAEASGFIELEAENDNGADPLM